MSCDKYINGLFNLLKSIENNNISNINIYDGNIFEILDSIKKKYYFDSIWVLFPDPWPKKKHYKRRLLSNDFFEKIYHYLNKDGKLYISTDSSSYFKFILKNLHKIKHLYRWLNQDKTHLLLGDYFAVDTKYYKKAIISGRKPCLLILKKL